MKFLEKLKDVLSPEDLNEVKSELEKVIAEKVDVRLQLEKEEMAKLADEYAAEKTKKALKKAKKKMEEQFNTKLESLEESVITKLDRFIDNEISSKISDELLHQVAINEMANPIIDGLMNLLEDRYVRPSSKGDKLIKSLRSELKEAKEEKNKLISEKMELATICEQTAIKSLLAEKSKVLTESQTKKFERLCEGKTFEELHKQVDTIVEMIQESTKLPKKDLKESRIPSDTVSSEELLPESKKVETDVGFFNESFISSVKGLV